MSLNRNWLGLILIKFPKETEMGTEYNTSVGTVNLELMRLQHKIYESTGLIVGVIVEIYCCAVVTVDVAGNVDAGCPIKLPNAAVVVTCGHLAVAGRVQEAPLGNE